MENIHHIVLCISALALSSCGQYKHVYDSSTTARSPRQAQSEEERTERPLNIVDALGVAEDHFEWARLAYEIKSKDIRIPDDKPSALAKFLLVQLTYKKVSERKNIEERIASLGTDIVPVLLSALVNRVVPDPLYTRTTPPNSGAAVANIPIFSMSVLRRTKSPEAIPIGCGYFSRTCKVLLRWWLCELGLKKTVSFGELWGEEPHNPGKGDRDGHTSVEGSVYRIGRTDGRLERFAHPQGV